MGFIQATIDFIINIDKHLVAILNNFGAWSYMIMFAIIFAETGLVILPFLPGDSLLFVIGALSVKGGFNILVIYPVLVAAAIIGDSVNYYLGHKIGRKAFKSKYVPFINHNHLDKAEKFYEKHGTRTIIIARFIPIIRTFAPFVAGIGKMDYKEFIIYNICGGFAWVTLFTFLGYFFGNIPAVEENFTFVIFGIIILSIIPPIYEYIKTKYEAKNDKKVSAK
ncbi:MAG: DedA family protein [bacterium]